MEEAELGGICFLLIRGGRVHLQVAKTFYKSPFLTFRLKLSFSSESYTQRYPDYHDGHGRAFTVFVTLSSVQFPFSVTPYCLGQP